MSKPKDEIIGLALNGGILVASAGGAAIMRGLQQHTIIVDGEEKPAMEAFDYVSGLSGGCIPTLLYSYAQNVDPVELFDADNRIDDPSKITNEVLNKRGPNSIFETMVSSLSLRGIPMIVYGIFSQALDAFWTLTLWFGVLSGYGIQRNKHILTSSDDPKDDSISPRKGAKAIPLVMFSLAGNSDDNGASGIDAFFKVVHALFGFEGGKYTNSFVPTEVVVEFIEHFGGKFMLPFTASPTEVINATLKSEPGPDGKKFAVNSVPLKEWGGSEKPCSLEFYLGMATNFLSMGFGIDRENPEIQKYAMLAAQKRTVRLVEGGKEKERLFFDGGLVDGLGVPALVQRKVRTIVASMWAHEDARSYAMQYKACKESNDDSLDKWLLECRDLCLADIASYFGYIQAKNPNLCINRMFEDGRYHLGILKDTFNQLYEAGLPLVATLKGLKTTDNPFWGITAGETVDLTIIYVTLPRKFAEQIPKETLPPGKNEDGTSKEMLDEDGCFTNEEFKDFPNLAGRFNFDTQTQFWKYLRYGALSRRQSNMTAQLGSWIIKEAWDGLTVDGKKLFGGFKEILEKE